MNGPTLMQTCANCLCKSVKMDAHYHQLHHVRIIWTETENRGLVFMTLLYEII